jgi:hypothetical protein
MLPYRDSRVTKIALAVFFLLVVGYAYFEGRALLWGPKIVIDGRVMETSEPFISIEGRAERIASLSMNGTPIAVTEEGEFSEPYALTPGYNKITLEARDRFGKTDERSIEIMYTSDSDKSAPPPAPMASSTEAEASE